jgi:uncharacterized repeat protein (TIGR01451 family)
LRGIWRIVSLLAVSVLLLPAAAGAGPADNAADMGVTATVTPDKMFVGQTATFTLTATNAGPSRANVVRLTATPDSKVTVTSMTPSRPDENCAIKNRTVTCTVAFLEPGQTFQLALAVTTSTPGAVSLVAGVLAVEPDPNTANQQATAKVDVLTADPTPPTDLSVRTLPQFETSTFTVEWKGKDVGSGVAAYNVRYRSAPPNGGFGAYVDWKDGPLKTAQFTGLPGRTYCFSVSAKDIAGNAAPYSPETCTAVPLSARSFLRKGAWRLVTSAAAVGGRYAVSTQTNATLTIHGIQAKNIALFVTKCPTCGSIDVSWRGRALGTVDLSASDLKHVALTLVTSQSLQTGDFVVKVSPPPPPKVKKPKPAKPVKHHNKNPQPPAPAPPPTPPPAPQPVQIEAIGISRI